MAAAGLLLRDGLGSPHLDVRINGPAVEHEAILFKEALELGSREACRGHLATRDLVLQWPLTDYAANASNHGPTTLVVMVLGSRLMPAAPLGPGQHVVGGRLDRQDQAPEEPANLLDAQRDPRPRPALNAARLLSVWGGGRLFCNASTASAPARRTVRSA